MKDFNVLAICNSSQYEVAAYDAVRKEINLLGGNLISFFQDKCLDNEYLSYNSSDDILGFFLSKNGRKYDLSDFNSIWYLKPRAPEEILRYKPWEHSYFMQKQFYAQREAIWLLFNHKKWLNDPIKMYWAENKIFQLSIAKHVGFKIPKTLISSNPDEILEFIKSCRRSIIKPLNPTVILDHVIYTNEVKDKHLDEIENAKYSPSIYQELVNKSYELRITVVGREIFSAKIYSQDDEATAIDWRVKPKLNDYSVRMEPIDIPAKVEQRILELMGNLGLDFGCIDMIVTPENDYIFLEINPNGQWYFVQLRTEQKIAKAIANRLKI